MTDQEGLFHRWVAGKGCSMALLLCLLSVMLCEKAGALDLSEVFRLAEKNDPSFRSISFQREATYEGKRQAIGLMLPTLTGNAGYTSTSQDVESTDNDVFDLGKTDYDTTSYGLTLTQPLFHWDLIVGYQQARAENFWADAELLVARQALMVHVTDLYLKALSAQDQLDYATAELKSVEKHYELAQGRHQMGLIPITDLYDAKARLASVQAISIETRNLLDDAKVALEEVIGEPVTAINPLREKIALLPPDPVSLESWLERALEQNPSIKLQQHAVDVADYEVRRQFAAHYPTLDVVGHYTNEDSDGTVFGGGGVVDTYDVMVQLSIPFYQGGIVNSKVRAAKHKLSSARQDLTKETRSVARQTRAAFLGVDTALKKIDALDQSMTANRMALETKQEGYLSGLFTSLNILDAERDVSLVSIDYAKARYRYVLNSLQLKQAAGSLTANDLDNLNKWFTAGE
ncbi:TolC family outer membrane protein [Desulforhopalus vacuolatus]|uniref:TolC family outer membrane protein n=1 Tax=Desulforhopalus vacuolatus TaxID=40414 RepID=UPI0019639973|nr:TolC family outer membrane protein [Desulforhopalus vacuolatus]MBM9518797.1 TolC family outer membrane protein [Desulforhopalus vacuolatus]